MQLPTPDIQMAELQKMIYFDVL